MKMRSFQVCQCSAPLQANDAEAPKPQGTQVLLKMLAAGVCHSDLHIWDGYYEIGGGKKLMLADRGIKLPLTMGHENVGEVVAVGPDAKGVKVGDVRLVNPWMGCGECKVCQRGDENLCLKPQNVGVFSQGGYATHMLVPEPAPPVRHRRPYARTGRAARVLRRDGVQRAEEDRPRDPEEEAVVIIGAGGVGLMGVTLAKKMGAKESIIVDIDAAKREAALKAGATEAIDGSAPDAVAQIQAATGGGAWGGDRFRRLGPDREACGRTRSSRAARVVVVGLFGGDVTVADALSAAARDDPARLLCGQPDRHGRAARPGEAHRHAAGADQDAAARRSERHAERPARRQDRRPRGADAGGCEGAI